jgi:glycosyltransferase 2 family protein
MPGFELPFDGNASTAPRRRWSRWLRWAFGWLAVFGMGIAIWSSREFLLQAWARARPGQLATATVLWTASHFVSPRFTQIVLGRTQAIDYRAAFAVHALRLPAKYLPGGIWHMVGRLVDFSARGHGRTSLIEFVLMENLVAAGFAICVGSTLLAITDATAWAPALTALALLAAVGLTCVPWAVKVFARADRILGTRRYLELLVVAAAFWATAGTAFVVFVGAFGPGLLPPAPAAIYGTYLFSWGAGFIAFFAPQGVGVFEFVAGTLLEGRLALAHAVALLASFRLVVLAGDALAWVIALSVFGRATAAMKSRRMDG